MARFSCRIGRRADKQGPRSSVGDQAEIESKYATATHPRVPEDNPTEDAPRRCLLSINTINPSKRKRQKSLRDEYKEVMKAYYDAIFHVSETSAWDETYNIWTSKNPTKRPYLDENKLASPVVPSSVGPWFEPGPSGV